MVQLTTEQFVVLEYNRTYSLVAVQNAFRETFPDRNPAAQKQFYKTSETTAITRQVLTEI